MKFLLWGLIIAAVIWLLRNQKNANGAVAQSNTSKKSEAMVQCAHCGVYVPASEAMAASSGSLYCCQEHLRHAS